MLSRNRRQVKALYGVWKCILDMFWARVLSVTIQQADQTIDRGSGIAANLLRHAEFSIHFRAVEQLEAPDLNWYYAEYT